MCIFNRLVKPLCLCKARKITDHCGRFVHDKVLDVGAGRCYIAKEIKDRYGVDITCIDIDDLNETDLELMVYDGRKIPYRSNTFGTILLVYVLHHCEDPISVLRECIRVCGRNGRIIIFEDTGFSLPTHILDWIGNKLHNVEAPLNFKKKHEWLKVFRNLNLELVYSEDGVERQFFYPMVGHTMFILRVGK